ncbi:uncharacterized protein LOC125286652 isoform X1 [Alosa alosa]|uniref:uncharacterized protein LOC125286652 isoform X1 n=1 Tax=Alosa alosa TaxID=278164 RepID=UPI0020154C1D|nr:uncharacterized protein LOC125286652 isoform X1 [Alosa alosa]
MFISLFILVAVTVTEEHPTVSQGTVADGDTVHPARIYGPLTSELRVGEDFEVKCSTFGLKKDEHIFVYLCKNGVGIKMMETKKVDSEITIRNVQKDHTGNYSCVFSRTRHPTEVKGKGENVISLQVTDKVFPAWIDVNQFTSQSHSVTSGTDVLFGCRSENAPASVILMAFLCRNETIIDVELWDSQKKQASFLLKRVQIGDTGSYGCLVSDQPMAARKLDTCGKNSVPLQVENGELDELDECASSGAAMAPLYLLPSLVLLVLLVLLLWRNGIHKQMRSPKVTTESAHFHTPEQTSTAQNHFDFTNTGLQIPMQTFYATTGQPSVNRTDTGLQIPVQTFYTTSGVPGVDGTDTATSHNIQQDQGNDISSNEWSDDESYQDIATYQEIPDLTQEEAIIAAINADPRESLVRPRISATYATSKRQKKPT